MYIMWILPPKINGRKNYICEKIPAAQGGKGSPIKILPTQPTKHSKTDLLSGRDLRMTFSSPPLLVCIFYLFWRVDVLAFVFKRILMGSAPW